MIIQHNLKPPTSGEVSRSDLPFANHKKYFTAVPFPVFCFFIFSLSSIFANPLIKTRALSILFFQAISMGAVCNPPPMRMAILS